MQTELSTEGIREDDKEEEIDLTRFIDDVDDDNDARISNFMEGNRSIISALDIQGVTVS